MLAFHPANDILASAGNDAIRFWHVESGQAEQEWSAEDGAGFLSLAFSPDGSILVAGDDVGRLWRLENDVWAEVEEAQGIHQSGITALAYHPTEPILASGSWDQSIVFWDTQTFDVISKHQEHEPFVTSLAFRPRWFDHALRWR